MPNKCMIEFFENHPHTAFTFDDVLARTNYADFYPHEVRLRGRISRNVELPLPIAGAAMSAVVGVEMAIALAKHGGIGSIPRSFDPEAQARIAARVKHYIHGFIDQPIPAHADESVAELKARREKKGWKFDSFPVLDEQGKFVGLMTHSNFKRCDDESAKVGRVMTPLGDLITAETSITKQEAYELLRQHDKNVLPMVDQRNVFKGMYVYSDLKRVLTEKHNHAVDAHGRLRAAAAIGVGEEAVVRAELLVAEQVDVLHIDMAHGAQRSVVETLRALKTGYKDGPDIIAGNVSNGPCARVLLEAGADGILIGQGGGSICTTRVIAGIGQPQITAVWECAQALEGSGVPVCSDGGIRFSGDAVLAFCAGADSVMVGNLLAGTDEAPGEKQLHNNTYRKDYWGMGSLRAMRESAGSRQRYLQGQGAYIPEGVEGSVPYKGAVRDTLEQLEGGWCRGFHYVGARNLTELHDKACFVQVTGAGNKESHPHDITMTMQPPNYRGI